MAAGGTILPASPRDAASGDVDDDGTAEIVLLIEWPAWTSFAEDTGNVPGRSEITVQPAIEIRRELWVLESAAAGLARAAKPLRVDEDVVAIDGKGGDGPVVALTRDGPAWVRAGPSFSGETTRSVVSVEPLAALPTPIARSEGVLARLPLLSDLDGDGRASVVVPTETGLAVVGTGGDVSEVPLTQREVRSGPDARLTMQLPRLVDLDRDGTPELLEVEGGPRGRVSWQAPADGGGYAPATVWYVGQRYRQAQGLRRDGGARDSTGTAIVLSEVSDPDADGTLELTLGTRELEDPGIGEALDALRGKSEVRLASYPLRWNGTVARKPERRFSVRGHPMYVRRSAGPASPFVDLDRDGTPELLTVRIRIGVFGIARTLASGEASPEVELSAYRRSGEVWKRVDRDMPEVRYRLDLDSGELSQYARIPGDVTGDGLWDLVEIDERTVRVYPGRGGSGAPIAEEPAREHPLMAPIRSWQGAVFVDLDGSGCLDMLAFEPVEPEADGELVDPVRVERVPLCSGWSQ